MRCPVLQLRQSDTNIVTLTLRYLHGGKTWAASPQRITRPKDQRLQLLAEKEKGRDLMHSMQSAGQAISCESLCLCQHRDKGHHLWYTYPYFLPEWRRYGNIIFLVSSSVAIRLPSSPSLTTNSKRHSRSSVRPKRPQTAGLAGSQMKLKYGGKNKLYTSSGV